MDKEDVICIYTHTHTYTHKNWNITDKKNNKILQICNNMDETKRVLCEKVVTRREKVRGGKKYMRETEVHTLSYKINEP